MQVGPQPQRGLELLDRLGVLRPGELLLVDHPELDVRLVVRAVHPDRPLEVGHRLEKPAVAGVHHPARVIGGRKPGRLLDRCVQGGLRGDQIAAAQRRQPLAVRGLCRLGRRKALGALELAQRQLEVDVLDELRRVVGRAGPRRRAQQLLVHRPRLGQVVLFPQQIRQQSDRLRLGGQVVRLTLLAILRQLGQRLVAMGRRLGLLELLTRFVQELRHVGPDVIGSSLRPDVLPGELLGQRDPLAPHLRAVGHPRQGDLALLDPHPARVVGPEPLEVGQRPAWATTLAHPRLARVCPPHQCRRVAGIDLERRRVLADRVVVAPLLPRRLGSTQVRLELRRALRESVRARSLRRPRHPASSSSPSSSPTSSPSSSPASSSAAASSPPSSAPGGGGSWPWSPPPSSSTPGSVGGAPCAVDSPTMPTMPTIARTAATLASGAIRRRFVLSRLIGPTPCVASASSA